MNMEAASSSKAYTNLHSVTFQKITILTLIMWKFQISYSQILCNVGT
jgi:hypothetical protein